LIQRQRQKQTQRQQQEDVFVLKNRDGKNCLYCENPVGEKFIIEHLNNNPNDTRIVNKVLAHQSCNKKKQDYLDYQIKAQEKLKFNEANEFVCPIPDNTPAEASTEIKINQQCRDIITKYISETINVDQKIEWDDALFSSTYLCTKETGHGSVNSTRNHLMALTSQAAPYMVTKDQKTKKKIIIKRLGQ